MDIGSRTLGSFLGTPVITIQEATVPQFLVAVVLNGVSAALYIFGFSCVIGYGLRLGLGL